VPRVRSRLTNFAGNYTRIFVPAEGNVLAQVLLARGVNGESPVKRRSPRKSTAARNATPKSVRSAKVATKTPRTASKRARKSIVVPGANAADEDTIAPASAKKNKGVARQIRRPRVLVLGSARQNTRFEHQRERLASN
jgi:hypothetical protein